MNVTYTKQGDYFIPNLVLESTNEVILGQYYYLRLEYLKQNKVGFYTV